jgi:hypothetical protein
MTALGRKRQFDPPSATAAIRLKRSASRRHQRQLMAVNRLTAHSSQNDPNRPSGAAMSGRRQIRSIGSRGE